MIKRFQPVCCSFYRRQLLGKPNISNILTNLWPLFLLFIRLWQNLCYGNLQKSLKNILKGTHISLNLPVPCLYCKNELFHSYFLRFYLIFWQFSKLQMVVKFLELLFFRPQINDFFGNGKFYSNFHCMSWPFYRTLLP